jgi:pimeloyl-ACP methyl ester carboxylesterase
VYSVRTGEPAFDHVYGKPFFDYLAEQPALAQIFNDMMTSASSDEGAAIALLHGFPQHWWQWRAIAPVIAAGGYRVICPDLRGAGWTVADDPRVERETRLRDLLALFDVLHIERAPASSPTTWASSPRCS